MVFTDEILNMPQERDIEICMAAKADKDIDSFKKPLSDAERDYFNFMKRQIDEMAKYMPREKITFDFRPNDGWE